MGTARHLWHAFSGLFQPFALNRRSKRIESRSQQLGVYFCSSEKNPPIISRRSFELFYHSRVTWTVLQVIFFSALAIWTLKNYVSVIKSL